jgi:hypothetical protein
MRKRIVRWSNVAALATFVILIAVVALVYAASFSAPPQAETRAIEYDDSPDVVAADAVHNLRAGEYTYDVRVVESGGPWEADGRVTTVRKHTEIDNGARRLSGRIRLPVMAEDGEGPAVRFFIESPIGQRYTPDSEETRGSPGWHRDRGLGFHTSRNAFDAVDRVRGASARVVATNDTTCVVRITNASVAVSVAYPGRPSPYGLGFAGFGGKTTPPTANATANLTIFVDKGTDRPTRAVLRYWNPSAGRHGGTESENGYRSTTTYRFSAHGAVDVDRPLGTYPPSPRTVLYRLDLGVYAIRHANYGRWLVPVLAVIAVAGLLVRTFDERGDDRP